MNNAIDIVTYKNEDREITAWGVAYQDGSVKWFDTLEEAESRLEDDYLIDAEAEKKTDK